MLNRFVLSLRKFMYGRYGSDSFGFALILISLIISIISNFFGHDLIVIGTIIRIISTLLLLYAVFRMFSKNISKRREENNKFIKIWYPVKNKFSSKTAKMKDTSHKYFKCTKCKQQVRVPAGRGKIEITCPKCGHKFIKKS